MKQNVVLAMLLGLCGISFGANVDVSSVDNIDFPVDYSVIWHSPSETPSGSMPFGGGDIGGNVWVEAGNLYLYLQQSGCFCDNGEFLKLGRWRIALTPNPFVNSQSFKQELHLKDGYVSVSVGNGEVKSEIKVWVDIFTRSVHFMVESDKRTDVKVVYESWRTQERELLDRDRGRFGAYSLEFYPGKLWKAKDTIQYAEGGILFYHRNSSSPLSPNVMIEQQGVSAFKDQITDLNSNLTFGGLVSGKNLMPAETAEGVFYGTPFKSWSLKSRRPAREHHVVIATHKEQTVDVDTWIGGLRNQVRTADRGKGYLKKNIDWWNNFWNKSWIITDPFRKEPDKRVWRMGHNYQLMRYQLGCNYYGDYPSKFNDGNFTFDPVLVNSKMQHDPDYRQWGGDVFTAQNQRLLYWPMLKSGDFEAMKSQFNLYEWGLNGAQAKVRTAFGHRGAIFSEYAHASGLDVASGWGWKTGKGRLRGREAPFGDPHADATHGYNSIVERGVMANIAISYHWESQVEYAYMMLEYHRFTGKNIDRYMPFIKNALIFFDEHYRKRQMMRNGQSLDEDGKLIFFPSTSCESYRGAKNPTDLVSGLRSCLEELLKIDSDSVSTADKKYFEAYLHNLPGLYYETKANGDVIVKPAASYKRYQNEECPQFYPLFPFNRFDIKSSELPIFRNTWKHGRFIKDKIDSWHQDGIFYARMGMVDKAFEYNLRKLDDSVLRFPTFWGPGHDWVPDHNWGGSGMIGLQEMLMQTVGDRIYLLPAWPVGKDVCFKLHAPYDTVIELEYISGEIRKLEVYPAIRRKDVEILLN